MQRKTVTVLFCDVTGSTALGDSLDPEALRTVLARYFERMKAIVERREGTVEKFIGDAVMAVFGVPAAHEDDALRAVRAAAEMLAALPELGVQARIGVNTGTVVTGTEERNHRAAALAMLGRLDEARALLADLRADVIEWGASQVLAAEEESCRLHEELDQLAELSTAAGGLAQAQYELGRLEDAEKSADRAAELGAPDDATTQMLWRQAVAKVLARRGELAKAERLAREAVAIGARTDMLNAQADADADLGEVLVLAGRAEEAAETFERALSRYEAKENVVMAGRARERLAELRAEVG